MARRLPDAAPAHAEVAGQHVRLGKLEAKKDKRNLKLVRYVSKAQLAALPAKVTRYTKVPSWPMYDNNSLGDCTVAAAGHMEQAWSIETTPETPPNDLVVGTYWATGSQDDGRFCLDVLNRWHNFGLGRNGSDEKIAAFVELNRSLPGHFKYAIHEFGGAYIGLELPLSAQTQTQWKLVSGTRAKPGSWGGHCVNLVGYDRYGAYLVTWGAILNATWGFLNKYCDEAYAIISPDWFDAAGVSPADAGGFKIDQLQKDLGALRA